MTRGSKDKYTDKQKRMAAHIEESYEESGLDEKQAASRAWATVNKETGGGEKSAGGGTRKSAKAKAASRKSVGRSAAGTRQKRGTNKGNKKAHGRGPTPTKRTRAKGTSKSAASR